MAFVDCFWHDHPLQITSIPEATQARCFICTQPVSGYAYRCQTCKFFLHIPCLNLPLQSLHPLHNHHPLTLLSNPISPKSQCSKCKTPCSGFTYNCRSCSFTLHLQCALKQQHPFKLEIHNHPLTFHPSSPSGDLYFLCHICGQRDRSFCFACNICHIYFHVECCYIPVMAKSDRHRHYLSLTSVSSVDDGSNEFYCDLVCEGEVNPKSCVYHCAQCNYMAHIGCVTSAPTPLAQLAYKEAEITPNPSISQTARLVFADPEMGDDEDEELVRMRHQFVNMWNGDVVEVQHFSHTHNLVLSNVVTKRKVSCRGCWGEIKGLAYSCSQCSFYLHKWCGELPGAIKHPIHPRHALTLCENTSSDFSQCNACEEPSDGFIYKCRERYCGFLLHAICASIPKTLRNDVHKHPLALRSKVPYSAKCQACCEDSMGTIFECGICNLQLHFKCALLPYIIRHRCHVHRLALVSRVEEDEDEDSDEFYCDACEQLRDPKHWVYSCLDGCEYNAHMTCVVSELLGAFKFNSQGPLDFNHHQHLLSLITSASSNPY